jgi:PiT family inorganic phosphate transporter
MHNYTLAITIIAFALIFDFFNGFHDSANSVATIVSTRVLSPLKAVFWAAFFNFVAAFTFGVSVANTMGKGFVDTHLLTPYTLLGGVLGAIAWDWITWYFGLPTSSTHALIGGIAGAAMTRAAFLFGPLHSSRALVTGKWPETIAFIAIAPIIGTIAALVLMMAVYWTFKRFTPGQMDRWFRHLQFLSAAALSFSHGTNDAQKTMGVITGVLVATGIQKSFHVPIWVILAAHASIGLGTLAGGWRIVHTVGRRLTPLKPRTGFCAEAGAAFAILFSTHLGLPVSTTHCLAGSITGVGSVQRLKAVRWPVLASIVWAWVLTIPASAVVAGLAYAVIRPMVHDQ